MARFGVQAEPDASGLALLFDEIKQLLGQNALIVIGNDEGFGLGQETENIVPKFYLCARAERLRLFAVVLLELLAVRQIARLGRGGVVEQLQNGIHRYLVPLQEMFEGGSGVIASDGTGGENPCAELRKVASDIGSAAGDGRLACKVDDRNRRLGADPLDVAPDIAVQYQVAQNQYAGPGEGV